MADRQNDRSRNAAILAIGHEVVARPEDETNSAFLAAGLAEIGWSVTQISLVPDNISQIAAELRHLSCSSSLIITTGGLGPTSDDLTREAVAEVLGAELELSEDSWKKLVENYERRGRPLHENSKRQSYFPKGATVISNPVGTADAFRTTGYGCMDRECSIVCLPGVPHEMKYLMNSAIFPWLTEVFPPSITSCSSVLKCFGASESYIGSAVEACTVAENIHVAYRASFPVVTVSFTARGNATREALRQHVQAASRNAKLAIGEEFVFGEDAGTTLGSVVGDLLSQRGLSLACAESCTGGLISDMLVSIPGASKYFLGSVVSYADLAKSVFLGVPRELLQRVGAVSAEVAQEMALGVRCRTGADIGVSVTGIAGPSGGTADKPIGTVWIGLSTEKGVEATSHLWPAERNRFRLYTAALALDVVRRKLLNYPLTWEKK